MTYHTSSRKQQDPSDMPMSTTNQKKSSIIRSKSEQPVGTAYASVPSITSFPKDKEPNSAIATPTNGKYSIVYSEISEMTQIGSGNFGSMEVKMLISLMEY